jgi:hypothetical protein
MIRNFRTHVLKLRIFGIFPEIPKKFSGKILIFSEGTVILLVRGAKWSKGGVKWRR